MPFPAKPEVEIWRKPDVWTRCHRLPIRSPIHYGTYLDSMWQFTLVTFVQGPLLRALDLSDFFMFYRSILAYSPSSTPICSKTWKQIFTKISEFVGGRALPRMRDKYLVYVCNVAHQRAPVSAKNAIFATFSLPVQKVGGSWSPVPIPSNLLWCTLKAAI